MIDTPRAILFDWDHTLVDNWATIHEALNATLRAMGQSEWTFEETLLRVRESLGDSFPRMFGDRWEEARQVFYENFEANHLKTLDTLDGAQTLIETLAGTDCYLGVVSNKRGDLLRKEAEHLGWSQFFGRIVGAGDASADKPDIAPVDLVLADSGIERGRAVWFVGDSAIDMQCANAANCTAVLVGEAEGEHDILMGLRVDHQFADCTELATLAAGFKRPI